MTIHSIVHLAARRVWQLGVDPVVTNRSMSRVCYKLVGEWHKFTRTDQRFHVTSCHMRSLG